MKPHGIWSRALLASAIAFTALRCGDSPVASKDTPLAKADKATFTLLLTDAPLDEAQSVFINVAHVELLISGAGKSARVRIAEDLGPIDLLTLRNGVTLPMASAQLPVGATITQIRLVLHDQGHAVAWSNEQICPMKTPSAQRTGVKLIIRPGIEIKARANYTVIADFDAEKSVVLRGRGDCLLKPVIKLKSATQAPSQNDEPEELPVSGDNASDDDGFDNPAVEEEEPTPVVNLENLNAYLL